MTNKNVYILAFTLVVMMLGIGVVIPIIPFFIEKFGAGGAELGLLVASYATMRLIFGPIWGSLSDRFGRKPILMIGVFGYGLAMIFFGLSTKLWMLFVSRTLSGILSSATSPTTMAYISDTTTEEDRSKGMGILGAAMGIGTIIGPGVGGLLGGESISLPFFIAGGMSFLALLLIALLLPESLPQEARRTTGEKKSTLSLNLLRDSLFSPVGILLFITFLMTFGMMIFYGVFGLYALEKFGSGPEQVGVVFMVFGFVSALAQGLIVGRLTKRWGEIKVIQAALLGIALGLLLISLSPSFSFLLIAVGIFTLATALLSPAVNALISKRATMEQGIMMGVSNSFMSLGRIVGPLWAGFAFDIYLEIPYLSGALVMFIGFLITMFFFSKEKSDFKLTSA